MSTWICIVNRIICTISIQMLCIWLVCLPTVSILRQKPSVLRIIIPCIQIIKPRRLIISSASITCLVSGCVFSNTCCLPKVLITIRHIRFSIVFQKIGRTAVDILVIYVIRSIQNYPQESEGERDCFYIVFVLQHIRKLKIFPISSQRSALTIIVILTTTAVI